MDQPANVFDLAAYRHSTDITWTHEEKAEFARLSADLLTIPYCPWTPNWICSVCHHSAHDDEPCEYIGDDAALATVGFAVGQCRCTAIDAAIPSPQVHYLLDYGREALYGGAAGGGKSIALMMSASQFLDVPGYSALLLRKSFPDLGRPGALMDIAGQWWGGQKGIKFNTQAHSYTFDCPGGGTSQIVFGSLDSELDRYKYQGGAFQYLGWDELTQQKERDYRYLFSRVRRVRDPHNPLSRVPIRVRSTTNPGGIGHDWVNRRFIIPWLAWKQQQKPRPKRHFYPALIKDNPKLDEEDYIESLMELGPLERAQLMKGDWTIRPDGRMFSRSWFKPIAYADVPGNLSWVRFWDMASTDEKIDNDPDFTAGCLVGRSPTGQFYIMDMRHWRIEAAENDLRLRYTAEFDSHRVVIAMEQEPGASGKIAIHHYRAYVLPGYNLRGFPASGSKVVRAGPVASQANAGNVFMVEAPWNDTFLDEIEIFPDGGVGHDDQVDALSGAMGILQRMAKGQIRLGATNEGFETGPPAWKPAITPDSAAWEGTRLTLAREEERPLEMLDDDKRELDAKVAAAWSM